jgi:transposase-like protein
MTAITRKSDGRRIFTDEFKREQIGFVWRGELTVAELGRKLKIAPSLLQRWKWLFPHESGIVSPVVGRMTSAIKLGAARYIRELQLLVGKQTVELELLHAELDLLKSRRRPQISFRQ